MFAQIVTYLVTTQLARALCSNITKGKIVQDYNRQHNLAARKQCVALPQREMLIV